MLFSPLPPVSLDWILTLNEPQSDLAQGRRFYASPPAKTPKQADRQADRLSTAVAMPVTERTMMAIWNASQTSPPGELKSQRIKPVTGSVCRIDLISEFGSIAGIDHAVEDQVMVTCLVDAGGEVCCHAAGSRDQHKE